MVTATYKVRTHNGRTVKMTGAIEGLDEITNIMQKAKAAPDLLAERNRLMEIIIALCEVAEMSGDFIIIPAQIWNDEISQLAAAKGEA